MGLYTKKVKDDAPVKEKKRGRPKKVVEPEVKEPEVEQPKPEEPAPVETEPPKPVEVKEPEIPRQKTPSPPEPVQEIEVPLKKPAPKKKVEKKVEKKIAPKEEKPPAWFNKFISQMGSDPNATKQENVDMGKEAAKKIWNDRVLPKNQRVTPSNNYDRLFSQIFGK